MTVAWQAIEAFVVLNAILILVAYVTLLERKFAARMQSRIGPYRVGPHGLLQPIADAGELMIKEEVVPGGGGPRGGGWGCTGASGGITDPPRRRRGPRSP